MPFRTTAITSLLHLPSTNSFNPTKLKNFATPKNALVTTLPIFKNLYSQNIFKNLYSQIHCSYHKFIKNPCNPPLHSHINHYKIHNFSIDTKLQSNRQARKKKIPRKLGKIYLSRTNTFATKIAFYRYFKILQNTTKYHNNAGFSESIPKNFSNILPNLFCPNVYPLLNVVSSFF